jgi:hypothetical protein
MVHINRKLGRRSTPVLASKRTGSTEAWFGSNGQLNAGSNSEAIVNLARLMQSVASGEVAFEDPNATEEMTAAQRTEMLVASYYDRSTSAWAETGSTIGAVLYETAVREGFLRRFLKQADLANGGIPRVNVRFQNVQALVAVAPTVVAPQIPKQKYIYPPEYYVLGNVRVEDRDIAQGAPDILEDAYARAMEQINVQEDRVLINMFDKSVGAANPLFLLAGGLTPSNLSAMRTAIIQWGLPAEQIVLSADYWTDIAGNAAAFGNLFDPVTKYELVQTGYLGTLLGMDVTTDGFRDPLQQVLAPNTMYILTSPINLGAYTDRGPVKSTPVDNYPDGIPGRGWYFNELLSTAVANPRGIVKGLRS